LRLLFDENLSRKLVLRLADLYPGSAHVAEIGLLKSPDSVTWNYAKSTGFSIVSADSDFYEFATSLGPPPKILWLRHWIHPTDDAEDLLRREAIRIAAFEGDPELGVLILDKN